MLKKKKIKSKSNKDLINKNNVKDFKYNLSEIELVLKMKLKSSVSFRGLEIITKVLSENGIYFQQKISHTTISSWVSRIGHYELNKAKERSDKWVIILDESIQVGVEKILVIFGIHEDKIDFKRPLKFQDLSPLLVKVGKSWNGESIKKELDKLQKSIGSISYAVGDYGSNIKKSLMLSNIPHIHDLTHRIAIILKSLYEKDEGFISLTKEMSVQRKKYYQTRFAYLSPPSLRKKSRYLNIGSLSDWAVKALNYLHQKNRNNRVINKLNYLKKYSKLILELNSINMVIKKIEKLLKHEGLSEENIEESIKYLNVLDTNKPKILRENLILYFNEMINLKPNTSGDKILCSSDIIESSFGKYKNYISNNHLQSITTIILSIPAFTASLDRDEIKVALESVKIKDIKKWKDKNIAKSLLKKRLDLLKPVNNKDILKMKLAIGI